MSIWSAHDSGSSFGKSRAQQRRERDARGARLYRLSHQQQIADNSDDGSGDEDDDEDD